MEKRENNPRIPVIVTTTYKGVFFCYVEDYTGDVIEAYSCRMAIYWGTTEGVMELAATGPTSKSKISAKCDMQLRGITSVMKVSEEAEAKWNAVP